MGSKYAFKRTKARIFILIFLLALPYDDLIEADRSTAVFPVVLPDGVQCGFTAHKGADYLPHFFPLAVPYNVLRELAGLQRVFL